MDLFYLNCFNSSNGDHRFHKILRNLIGPKCKMTDEEKHWYRRAVECHQAKKTFVFDPLPDIKIGTQPFCAWQVMLDMNRKWKRLKKRKICLLQLGEMPDFVNRFYDSDGKNFWHFLAQFLEVYFPGIVVELMDPALNFFQEHSVKTREHSLTGKQQYLASDIKVNIRVPTGATSVLALSWTDLYPCEELNFVLGEASFEQDVAVFCFGRFEPKLVAKTGRCEDIKELNGDIIYRLLRIISHETCHLFGLNHCVYFKCAMNESNSLELALSQPLLCCPFCLRKIQYVLDFRLGIFFQNFIDICEKIHLEYPCDFWSVAIKQSKEFLGNLSSPSSENGDM